MAETLTVDPTPQAEVAGEVDGVQLSAEEQDSLQVGTEIQEAQEGLLAGKYKTAAELEKAYGELQRKLGEQSNKDSEEVGDTEASEQVDSEETEEETEETEEASPAAQLITSASEEFSKSGELTPETLEKFNSMSSEDLVKAYIEVQAELPQTADPAAADIVDSQIASIKNSVGGDDMYGKMVTWASENLDQSSIDAFDELVNTGSVPAIQLAVNGLKAQYDNANGYEGTMVTGKAPTNTKDVYRSQAELVAAMSDRRYDNDPAYRQDVIAKLERSDNLTF
tara:strand:+ start:2042 stop:2884 length:843 start_codon:yes stop_codon:yes gene_type:complete